MSLKWKNYDEIVVLTGAGISVASGLGTYRGPGGLWEKSGVAKEATAEAMGRDPWAVWQFFIPLLKQISEAEPNAAHQALAEMEKHAYQNFTLVTQNVDGLHKAAGSQNLLELHGNLKRRRCISEECSLLPFDDETIPQELPLCSICNSPLRPDIVLFGERLPLDASHRTKKALRTVDLFLSIGTSGTVMPAANFVRAANYASAATVEFNLAASGNFQLEILGPCETTLPKFIQQTS